MTPSGLVTSERYCMACDMWTPARNMVIGRAADGCRNCGRRTHDYRMVDCPDCGGVQVQDVAADDPAVDHPDDTCVCNPWED